MRVWVLLALAAGAALSNASSPGLGSTLSFELTLPLCKWGAEPVGVAPHLASRVPVVEDPPLNRQMANGMLTIRDELQCEMRRTA